MKSIAVLAGLALATLSPTAHADEIVAPSAGYGIWSVNSATGRIRYCFALDPASPDAAAGCRTPATFPNPSPHLRLTPTGDDIYIVDPASGATMKCTAKFAIDYSGPPVLKSMTTACRLITAG